MQDIMMDPIGHHCGLIHHSMSWQHHASFPLLNYSVSWQGHASFPLIHPSVSWQGHACFPLLSLLTYRHCHHEPHKHCSRLVFHLLTKVLQPGQLQMISLFNRHSSITYTEANIKIWRQTTGPMICNQLHCLHTLSGRTDQSLQDTPLLWETRNTNITPCGKRYGLETVQHHILKILIVREIAWWMFGCRILKLRI